MPQSDEIRQRIESRIGQGQFLANLLHLAAKESSQVQEQFIDRLSRIATTVRDLMEQNDLIRAFSYRPRDYWPTLRGNSYAFLDAGVANIELPSAAPIGIRVGSYIVRPGHEGEGREQFNIELALVDDLYSDDGVVFDSDFLDVAKLRDAARMASETSVAYRLAHAPVDKRPTAIIMHGPLINPVSPYGLDDFPGFGLQACQRLLDDEQWQGTDVDRQFVPLYLDILNRLRATGTPVVGAVERSIGRDPVVLRRLLHKLQTANVLRAADAKQVLDDAIVYGLNDASLFDVVLREGEYITPLPVMRQGPESKWPDLWKTWIGIYPDALTTYLKPSEVVTPFRVEAFEDITDFTSVLDLILHTSRLLPSYGFPVGLDIVDRFAKVPNWMSRGVKSQHQIVLLKKALESGDPRTILFAKRVLAAKGRDWFFRPQV